MGSYTLTYSTELMDNYVQATTMAPEAQFQAVQKPDGQLLLFSVGEDGSFNVTAEVAGLPLGWAAPLSLNGELPHTRCTRFSAARRADGSIRLAMVVRSTERPKDNDVVHIADLTLATDGTVVAPRWTAFPYDDPNLARAEVRIAGVRVSEALDAGYTVIDVARDPASASKEIVRYFVDPAKPGGHAWQLHDVPVDIQSDDYATVLGRRGGAGVDGLYVGGRINDSPQLIYTPLVNELRPDRKPLSIRLALTPADDVAADALATCRDAHGGTDLYAAAHGALYRVAADDQRDGAVARVMLRHALFDRVTDLFVAGYDDGTGPAVMVWGRDADGAVFYTSCAAAALDAGAWSVPLPLLNRVQHLASFVNVDTGANTLVAHTADNRLRVGMKSPDSGLWTWRPVAQPTPATTPATRFTSYTTRIDVVDQHNQAAAGVDVAITAESVTAVRINHLYYVVGPRPIHVPTDATGTITIVEAIAQLTGTRFQAQVVDGGSAAEAVNPMDEAFRKASELQTVGQLRAATVTRYVDGKPTTSPLVRPGVDDATLQQVATLNRQCAQIYAEPAKAPPRRLTMAMAAAPMQAFAVPEDAPLVDSGDLFQALEAHAASRAPVTAFGVAATTGASIWDIIIRWFEDAWEFVVRIGDAIYRCVLKVVEDVVSAIRWVFDKIVTAIEQFVDFLKYLFTWDDFARTKDVLKNVTLLYLNHATAELASSRTKLDAMIDSIIAQIDAWAGIDDHLAGLGQAGTAPLSSQAERDRPDAAGDMLAHHFKGNVTNASGGGSGPRTPPDGPLKILENALAAEAATLGEAGRQLDDLFRDAASMSLADILKRVAGIVAGAVLRSARVVADALIDLLVSMLRAAIEALDTPVHIPVISDILNAVGVPDISMLDIVCWVAAVPVTIGYKVATGLAGSSVAPFPDSPETTFLAGVKDFETLQAAFRPPRVRMSVTATAASAPMVSPQVAVAVSCSLHAVAAVTGFVGGFVDGTESLVDSSQLDKNKLLTRASAGLAIVGGAGKAVANLLVPHYPLTNPDAVSAGYLFTGLAVLNKVYWAAADLPKTIDARELGATIDGVLVLADAAITVVHIVELAAHDAGKDRTMAILDESSSVASYIGRVLYAMIVGGFAKDPETKVVLAAAMAAASVVRGGLQLAEAGVEYIQK